MKKSRSKWDSILTWQRNKVYARTVFESGYERVTTIAVTFHVTGTAMHLEQSPSV